MIFQNILTQSEVTPVSYDLENVLLSCFNSIPQITNHSQYEKFNQFAHMLLKIIHSMMKITTYQAENNIVNLSATGFIKALNYKILLWMR